METRAMTPNDSGSLRAFAEDVVRRLRDAGHEALFAGGCVRDLLLGNAPKDFDVATSARPDEVRSLFRRTTAIGAAFGVIQVRGGGNCVVEVATFRADGDYRDGRHPNSVRFTDAREDALRRDFTINGMFLDPIDDRVLDFVGGQEDLKGRLIRAIGTPERRFEEDKLRLLRAVRFAARLGFEIEPATLDAVRQMAPQLSVVSGERILMELRALLESSGKSRGVEWLAEANLAPVLFSETGAAAESRETFFRAARRVAGLPSNSPFAVAIAAIFHELGGPRAVDAAVKFFERLKASNAERELCSWLLSKLDGVARAPSESLAFRKRLYADARWPWLCALARINETSAEIDWCEHERARLKAEEINPPPLLTGDDLKRHGFVAGPAFKGWLERVRDLQLNGDIASPSEAIEHVRRWSVTP